LTLSILIPVYNYPVKNLVNELLQQCYAISIEFEILLLDDGSHEFLSENEALALQFKEVCFLRNHQNKGRSASRNTLLKQAKGMWIWFLDCDVRAHENTLLVQNYLAVCQPSKLISGGRKYDVQKPKDAEFYLHWLWGAKRELLEPADRMKDPVNAFLSNNFWMWRETALSIQFNTELTGYGYEDTLFAAECRNMGIEIEHIKNPVIHEGLDKKEVFLSKIEESLHNLLKIEALFRSQNIDNPVKSKLTRAYSFLNTYLKWVVKPIAETSVPLIQKQLLSSKPSLFWFDMYRLAYLLSLEK
jgi:glycosyltransferase involved in cell wall biosynthesis